MGNRDNSLLDRALHYRAMQRWARAARNSATVNLATLRLQRTRARLLKAHLDRLIHTSDARLALPAIGSSNFVKPHNADWAWRPELWRGPLATPGLAAVQTKSKLGDEVTLFHDCDYSEITMHQRRNLREEDMAPYGLWLDVFRFDGSFLSLVIDLPDAAVQGLKKTHLLRVSATVEMEKPIEIFARINIRHGPNTEQIVRELPLKDKEISVEFDLAYSKLNEKRVERAWVDLIFEGPQMNQVVLRDVTLSRRPRAQI
ncbi:MAG: DUF6478 family protein [Sulfitobacter sp.]